MKQLNSVIYNKLLLQAEEAKEQKLTKLATGLIAALQHDVNDQPVTYSYAELSEDVYKGLWTLATNVIKYHGTESADAQKINDVIEILADKFIKNLEISLGADSVVLGPFEPKVLGEKR
jgi:hypothetical protein